MPAGAFQTPRARVGAGIEPGDQRPTSAKDAQPVVLQRVGEAHAREVGDRVAVLCSADIAPVVDPVARLFERVDSRRSMSIRIIDRRSSA